MKKRKDQLLRKPLLLTSNEVIALLDCIVAQLTGRKIPVTFRCAQRKELQRIRRKLWKI